MEDSDEGEEMVEEMDIEWAELYMSAQVIWSEILKMKNMIPWLPSAKDLAKENIVLPNKLYNWLAWVFDNDNDSDPIL